MWVSHGYRITLIWSTSLTTTRDGPERVPWVRGRVSTQEGVLNENRLPLQERNLRRTWVDGNVRHRPGVPYELSGKVKVSRGPSPTLETPLTWRQVVEDDGSGRREGGNTTQGLLYGVFREDTVLESDKGSLDVVIRSFWKGPGTERRKGRRGRVHLGTCLSPTTHPLLHLIILYFLVGIKRRGDVREFRLYQDSTHFSPWN